MDYYDNLTDREKNAFVQGYLAGKTRGVCQAVKSLLKDKRISVRRVK